MAFGVTLVGLVAALCLGSVNAEEGYAKEVPSFAFKEGPTPTPSPTTVSLPEGTPSAASPASPSPAPLTALATPGWPSPFSVLGAYPGAPVNLPGRFLGAYPGVPLGYPGLLGGYPASAVSQEQDYASRWYGPVAIPAVLPDGTLANTPQVADARAQHLAALDRARALWFGQYNDGSYNPQLYGNHAYPGYPQAAPGYAPAAPSYAPAAPGYAPSYPGYPYGGPSALHPLAHAHGSSAAWTGPLASPTVLPSGYLADTPEITAARAAHLATLSRSYEEAALWRSKALAKGWK